MARLAPPPQGRVGGGVEALLASGTLGHGGVSLVAVRGGLPVYAAAALGAADARTMLGEEEAPRAKQVKKEEKKARKRAKKDAKRSAKRARKESKKDGGGSSSSSDDDEADATLRQLAVEAARGGPVSSLPAAARWQGPALAPVASIASLEAQLTAARSARVARAAAGPASTAFGSSQIMPLRQSQAEVEMRGVRAARFEQTAAEKALAAAASRPVPKLPAGQVLKGNSLTLALT